MPSQYKETSTKEPLGIDVETRTPKRQKCSACILISVIIAIIALIVIVLLIVLVTRKRVTLQEGEFKHGAVSCDVPLCSEIGRDILKNDGSAIDAAISTALCIGVINSQSSGLGGGFIMTLYKRDEKKVEVLDARERAPANATEEFYQNVYITGPLSIGIPGELIGMWEAHKRYGRLKWKDLFTPVIEVAEKGFPLTVHAANALNRLDNLGRITDPLMISLFKKNGTIKSAGDHITRPLLAKTLKTIANDGYQSFYEGEMARKMSDQIIEAGGFITPEDFAAYKPRWREVLQADLRQNLKLYSPPIPSGGPIMQFIVRAIDEFGVDSSNFTDLLSVVQTHHRFVEAQKFGMALRSFLGDNNTIEIQDAMEKLQSQTFIKKIVQMIPDDHVTFLNASDYLNGVNSDVDEGGTAHISVVAENGDAVSLTTTVNYYYGSTMFSRDTGIVFNNQLADFTLGTPNHPAPGKEPLSSMCASIAVDDLTGDVVLVVGSAGSKKIITTNAMVAIRALFTMAKLKDIVQELRLHNDLKSSNILTYEIGFPSNISERLEAFGHKIQETSSFSVANVIQRLPNGHLMAISDERKQGKAAGY